MTIAAMLAISTSPASATTRNYTCVVESVAHLATDIIKQKWDGWTFKIAYQRQSNTAQVSDPLIRAEIGRAMPVKVERTGSSAVALNWTLFHVPVRSRHSNDGSVNFRAIVQEGTGRFLIYVTTRTGTYASRGTGKCRKTG